jgi:hypothetical protein
MADSTAALQTDPAVSAPASQAAAAAAPEGAKSKKQAGSNLICRNEPTLGTRLPTKKCRTAEQIAQQRAEDQANLDRMQRRDEPGH